MKFNRKPADAPEINLIPFIDILLVVLIFLVLTTSYQRQTGLAITLPSAQPQAAQKPAQRITVGLDVQGHMSINGQAFSGQTLGELQAALNALASEGSDAVVVIHADAQVAHQLVMDVMSAARMAGLSKIVFSAQARNN